MSARYTDLSEIYEGMYRTFINYEEEFAFYLGILKKYQCQSVLEAGCGTGNLAPLFARMKVDYVGTDLSEAMLAMAKRNNPALKFIQGDMRNFNLPKPTQSCIITERSISYLVTDKDVHDAFHSMTTSLTKPGLLCFDFIDATTFLPFIEGGKTIMHQATVRNRRYHRESFWKIDPVQQGAFDWHSVFYEEQTDGSLRKMKTNLRFGRLGKAKWKLFWRMPDLRSRKLFPDHHMHLKLWLL